MKKIIKKVLEELGKEKPDISYIRGLLEAVYEEEPVTPFTLPPNIPVKNPEINPHDLPPMTGGNVGMKALTGEWKDEIEQNG